MLPRICNVIIFLVLTAESKDCFEKNWSTPWAIFERILYAPFPGPHLWNVDMAVLVMLPIAYSKKGAKTGRAKPLDKALWLSLASIALWVGWGVYNGGSAMDMRLQLHAAVMMYITSFLFITVYKTVEDFATIGRIVVYAALFRWLMASLFYVFFIRKGIVVACVLDHGDTILFSSCIVIVLTHALHVRNKKVTWRAVAITLAMLWAIQINNRRLAYIALIGGLVILYILASAGSARKRLHYAIKVVFPIIVLYVAVGWGRQERMFKPLQAFSSMGPDSKDPSTESRNLENLGLVNTITAAPVMGLGFGHEYLEVSDALAPREVFPQYRFVPHNSVLGLAGFMGGLGFAGIWMAFPVAAFLAARSYPFAKTPMEKTIAVVATAEVFIHVNEMYGDIGINATQGLVVMPAAFAAASRIAMITGAWPSKKKKNGRARQPSRADPGAARPV